MTPVATLELMEIRPDGERRLVQAQIGAPHYDERGSWACPVLLTSIDGTIKEIHGEDSMQALLLAVRFIHSMLRSLLEKGSRVVQHPDISIGNPHRACRRQTIIVRVKHLRLASPGAQIDQVIMNLHLDILAAQPGLKNIFPFVFLTAASFCGCGGVGPASSCRPAKQ